jgi:hypothetical protein
MDSILLSIEAEKTCPLCHPGPTLPRESHALYLFALPAAEAGKLYLFGSPP